MLTGGVSDLFSGNMQGALTGGLFPSSSPGPSDGLSATARTYLDQLQAYGLGMPDILSLQNQYQGQFTEANLQNLTDELMGVNGQPGYLSTYANEVVPTITGAQTAANTATRTANVADMNNLGPAAAATVRSINPGQTALMDSLTQTATDQLNLGTQLDPDTASNITSSVRNNWASRGLGTSAPASLDEAMQLYAGGQNLLQQRESSAGAVAGMNNSFYTNPVLSMMDFTSNAPAGGQTLTATGANQAGNSAVIPQNSAYDMFNTAFNASTAGQIAGNNNRAALEAAGIQAGGSIIGGAASSF
jgi:hypothetical protein